MESSTAAKATRQKPPLPDRATRSVKWRARRLTARWRALPDFVILGAQRSGTTSLFGFLSEHPSVATSFRKEVHFFDLHYDRGLDWYRAHFPIRPGAQVVGEATPHYLFDPRVPSRVAESLPETKFVVLLRDPVERAYSSWRKKRKTRLESLDFEAALDRETDRIGPDLDRIARGEAPQSADFLTYSYVSKGMYAEQLRRWFAAIPRERFLVLQSEELFARPRETLARLYAFIGASPWDVADFPWLNAAKTEPMASHVESRLRNIYRPHNAELYELLGWEPIWS